MRWFLIIWVRQPLKHCQASAQFTHNSLKVQWPLVICVSTEINHDHSYTRIHHFKVTPEPWNEEKRHNLKELADSLWRLWGLFWYKMDRQSQARTKWSQPHCELWWHRKMLFWGQKIPSLLESMSKVWITDLFLMHNGLSDLEWHRICPYFISQRATASVFSGFNYTILNIAWALWICWVCNHYNHCSPLLCAKNPQSSIYNYQ